MIFFLHSSKTLISLPTLWSLLFLALGIIGVLPVNRGPYAGKQEREQAKISRQTVICKMPKKINWTSNPANSTRDLIITK